MFGTNVIATYDILTLINDRLQWSVEGGVRGIH